MIKKHRLASLGELDAIIHQGEEQDGTADREALKSNPAVAAARRRNDDQLELNSRIIGQSIQDMLDADAKADAAARVRAARASRSQPPLYLPPALGRFVPGKPWSTWVPLGSMTTSKTR